MCELTQITHLSIENRKNTSDFQSNVQMEVVVDVAYAQNTLQQQDAISSYQFCLPIGGL